MPPSAGACHTTLAPVSPDWGRAPIWSSTMTATTRRLATAGSTSRPVSGAGTSSGVGSGVRRGGGRRGRGGRRGARGRRGAGGAQGRLRRLGGACAHGAEQGTAPDPDDHAGAEGERDEERRDGTAHGCGLGCGE